MAWSLGNLGEASIFVGRYGIADPDCFPWTLSCALYLSRPHGAELQALPIAPTPDRVGRTVRIAPESFATISDVNQKKQWIDQVGPMAAMFNPPPDFGGYGGGIYTPIQQGELEANQGELHYACTASDGQMRHFRRLAGGAWTQIVAFGSGITSAPCMIEAQFGAAHELDFGNFELCVVAGGKIEHWWRDNHGSGAWARSEVFGGDALRVVGLLQGSFGFNLEMIVERLDGRFQHYWRDGAGWHAGPIITAKTQKDTKDKDLKDAKEEEKLDDKIRKEKEADFLPDPLSVPEPLRGWAADLERRVTGIENRLATDRHFIGSEERPAVGEETIADGGQTSDGG